jgi:hypothetical protein
MEGRMKKHLNLMLDADENPANQGGEQPTTDTQQEQPQQQQQPEPNTTSASASQAEQKTHTNPMAQLRSQYDQTKKDKETYLSTLTRIAESQGLSVEELIAKQQEEADRRIAQQKGITPEIQKQLREYEERVKALEIENKRTVFNRNAEVLMAKYNMDLPKFEEFVRQAHNAGFDLIKNPSLDFDILYKALNYDTLVQTKEAQVRESILADLQQKQQQSPGINKTNNPNSGTPSADSSDDDIESWFASTLKELKAK